MPAEQESYNNYTCIGNLGSDPKITFFESGGCVANFDLAVYRGKDKDGNPKKPVWAKFKAFGATAEAIANQFKKGDRMQVIESRLDFEEWKDKQTGQNRKVQLFICWKFEKIERQQSDQVPVAPVANVANYDDIPF